MELFASQDPRSYSLYSDLNIWIRARKVTGLSRNGPLALVLTDQQANESYKNTV